MSDRKTRSEVTERSQRNIFRDQAAAKALAEKIEHDNLRLANMAIQRAARLAKAGADDDTYE